MPAPMSRAEIADCVNAALRRHQVPGTQENAQRLLTALMEMLAENPSRELSPELIAGKAQLLFAAILEGEYAH